MSKGRHSEIISSHPQEHLEREVRVYGIREFVQRIRGSVSDKVPVIKTAAQEVGADPVHVLYIGDTVQDIRAARDAGVGIASVTYGYHSEELLRAGRPDMIVSSLEELASQLGYGDSKAANRHRSYAQDQRKQVTFQLTHGMRLDELKHSYAPGDVAGAYPLTPRSSENDPWKRRMLRVVRRYSRCGRY